LYLYHAGETSGCKVAEKHQREIEAMAGVPEHSSKAMPPKHFGAGGGAQPS
jgi:hypothetical protein